MNRLFRVLSAALSAVLLTPRTSFADIDLTWDGCSNDAGIRATTFDCVGGGTRDLVGTFRLPSELPDFIGIQGTILIAVEGGFDMAPFWQYETGGCNVSHLTLGSFATPVAGCAADSIPWPTAAVGSLLTFTRTTLGARLDFAVSHNPPRSTPLAADVPYFGFRLQFDLATAASCAGCSTPAALYLEEFDVASLTAPALYLHKEGAAATCAMVNGASVALCEAVPVRDRTWGSIKSLYR